MCSTEAALNALAKLETQNISKKATPLGTSSQLPVEIRAIVYRQHFEACPTDARKKRGYFKHRAGILATSKAIKQDAQDHRLAAELTHCAIFFDGCNSFFDCSIDDYHQPLPIEGRFLEHVHELNFNTPASRLQWGNFNHQLADLAVYFTTVEVLHLHIEEWWTAVASISAQKTYSQIDSLLMPLTKPKTLHTITFDFGVNDLDLRSSRHQSCFNTLQKCMRISLLANGLASRPQLQQTFDEEQRPGVWQVVDKFEEIHQVKARRMVFKFDR